MFSDDHVSDRFLLTYLRFTKSKITEKQKESKIKREYKKEFPYINKKIHEN